MTKEEVKEYIDNYISHAIAVIEYGNWFSVEIKNIIEDCKEVCDQILEDFNICNTKQQSAICMKSIQIKLNQCASLIEDFILEQIDDVTDNEQLWLEENVADVLGINLTYPDKAKSLLKNIPIASAGIIGLFGTSIAEKLKTIYEQEVMSSYVTGSTFNDLDDTYAQRFDSFFRGIETESVNIGSGISSQYDRIIYTANQKKIKGYVWSAILDSHTCLVCGSLDGQKFTDISKIPMYPQHLNCRCILISYTEEIEDVIPKTYSEWFENQPESEKYKILGKTRFQLYEQGMKIKNFVNNGKITPLKDLNK